MTKQKYNCTEQELYTISEKGWNSCLQHLALFASFKPKYNLAFVNQQLDAIQTTRLLPDEQQRNSAYETASINLHTHSRICRSKWQTLKRYITDAFPPDQHKPMIESAGHHHYRKACNHNWNSVKGLLTSGSTFIASHHAILTANNNMPPAFQAEFQAARAQFESLHQEFIQAEQQSRVGQQTKITTNNQLHTDLMAMLLDGQEIFRNREANRKQFIFTELLYLASGAGTAGFKGTVTPLGSALGLQGVTVSINNSGKTTTTDADGKYEISQLPAATYTIQFNKEGYLETTITDFTVKVGTISTLHAVLTPTP